MTWMNTRASSDGSRRKKSSSSKAIIAMEWKAVRVEVVRIGDVKVKQPGSSAWPIIRWMISWLETQQGLCN